MGNYSFRLVLDRPMTPEDENVFDHSPDFAGGDVSLLLSPGKPTILFCDDITADSENAAVSDAIRRIGLINRLRVVEQLPMEDD